MLSATDVSSSRTASGASFRLAEAATQRIVVGEQAFHLGRQRAHVGEIHDADRAAADLVLVGRSDAASGRSDLGSLGRVRFAHPVQFPVQRQDKRGVFGYFQAVRCHFHALRLQFRNLGDEGMRIEDDAVADDRQLALAHDARRQQGQFVDLAVDDQRVARIVAALEAHHHIGAFGQPVDDLALALVTPLRADDHHIGHFSSLRCLLKNSRRRCKTTGLYSVKVNGAR